ncbi:putative btb poz-like protein [Venturia nashicola]|uniref:Putative btb poz-like protein n=1 Tax=Venturia nashicola TaxID=86259 RepID=A0A4Z1NWA8_9PEZI|nr:putative btb poz-like protein [Venturia nashicola]TLD32006.1 putative btb poz-like protein [Venturia nashicola]
MSTIQGSTALGRTVHGNALNTISFARWVAEPECFELAAHITPSFRTSGEYSDCVIKTQTGEHQVHKIVLCSQSPFFEKAVKKGTFEEGRTGVINMEVDRATKGSSVFYV